MRIACAGAAAALLAGVVGCTDETARQVGEMNKSNIQRLCNIYEAHQNYKGGKGPKDEAAFKEFIKAYDPNKLAMMGIDPGNVDGLFVSERDGKPFKIRYNVGGGRGSVAPIVFEAEGKDGKKQVASTGGGGKVDEVDDATYQQLWSGKGGSSRPAEGPPGGKEAGRPKGGRPAGAPTGPPG
jgi:hypothetical protein